MSPTQPPHVPSRRTFIRALTLLAGFGFVAGIASMAITADPNLGWGQLAPGAVESGQINPSHPTIGPPRAVGLVDGASPVEFELALQMPGARELDAYLAALYDPSSSTYRRFLSAAQFGEQFGLPLARIATLEAWARSAGLAVLGGFVQRTALRVGGTAAQLTRIFGVRLEWYQDPLTGRTFYAPLDAAVIPPAIADAVAGLANLDTRPSSPGVHLAPQLVPMDVPAGGMAPADLATAYDITATTPGCLATARRSRSFRSIPSSIRTSKRSTPNTASMVPCRSESR